MRDLLPLFVLLFVVLFIGGFSLFDHFVAGSGRGWRKRRSKAPICAVNYCDSLRDPRCEGLQCSAHCDLYCKGVCMKRERKFTVYQGGKGPGAA